MQDTKLFKLDYSALDDESKDLEGLLTIMLNAFSNVQAVYVSCE